MNKKPEQDTDLFRQALGDVVPIKPNDRHVATPTRRFPQHLQSVAAPITDNLSDHGAGDIALTNFFRNGLNRMTLRKLRRGEWPPQESLDLHGCTNDEARRLLVQFLHHALQCGLRCVSVIHGQGWRSEGRDGILKVNTRHWLTQHAQVLAFCEAPTHAGGGGAVWVLLKSGEKI
ncbi:MAG: DNA mismatch repair protein MutS [Sideroxydans sp.]|nr:DNA mismatch repair protein MutS [Sideroxydans sp.]